VTRGEGHLARLRNGCLALQAAAGGKKAHNGYRQSARHATGIAECRRLLRGEFSFAVHHDMFFYKGYPFGSTRRTWQ